MIRKYSKLSVEDFGRILISSEDLDPVYVALSRMEIDDVTLRRWLLAYWCCYDAGVACYVAEAPDPDPTHFWVRMRAMAENTLPAPIGGRWRRAPERRHWRGQNATRSLESLRNRYYLNPENMAGYCAHGGIPGQAVIATQTTCEAVMTRAREHVAFGPWIAFKVADMAERVMGVSVSFDRAEVFLFDAPREGALLAWNKMRGDSAPRLDLKDEQIKWMVEHLTETFADLVAPPKHDRPIGLQEVETVLCKWKSHVQGHYPLYTDIIEGHHHILPWLGVSDLARRYEAAFPRIP